MFNYIKTRFEGFEGCEGSEVMLGWIVLLMRMNEILLLFTNTHSEYLILTDFSTAKMVT
jgi:hypothetical protein